MKIRSDEILKLHIVLKKNPSDFEGHTSKKILKLAETKGFEPLIEFPLYTLSRRAPSTTRTRLHF
jgi:hypothetical protein